MTDRDSEGTTQPVRVVFIGGCGRSGSTLLDRMLGQVDGFVSVGELTYLWRRGVIDDQQCGCGEPFSSCPFWVRIGLEAFGGWARVDAAAAVRLQRDVDRLRFVPLMIAPWLWPPYRARLASYQRLMSMVYIAIHRATEGGIVVDSTKHVSDAFALRAAPSVNLHLIHLVRDGRGVAYSWTKEVSKPEAVHAGRSMRRFHPVRMALRWLSYNVLFQASSTLGVPYARVRYEDLVQSPRSEMQRILGGMPPRGRPTHVPAGRPSLDFIHDHRVELVANHTVAGNPMRFKVGRLDLRLDDEWERRFPPMRRRVVTMMTWPLLRAYGYPRPV